MAAETPVLQNLLHEAMAALRRGDKVQARDLLTTILEVDDRNEPAWLWMSGAVDSPAEQRICLENVLLLNPGSTAARRGLEELERQEGAAPAGTPAAAPGAGPTHLPDAPSPAAAAPPVLAPEPAIAAAPPPAAAMAPPSWAARADDAPPAASPAGGLPWGAPPPDAAPPAAALADVPPAWTPPQDAGAAPLFGTGALETAPGGGAPWPPPGAPEMPTWARPVTAVDTPAPVEDPWAGPPAAAAAPPPPLPAWAVPSATDDTDPWAALRTDLSGDWAAASSEPAAPPPDADSSGTPAAAPAAPADSHGFDWGHGSAAPALAAMPAQAPGYAPEAHTAGALTADSPWAGTFGAGVLGAQTLARAEQAGQAATTEAEPEPEVEPTHGSSPRLIPRPPVGARVVTPTVPCPNCAELVTDNALSCPHCQYRFYAACPHCGEYMDTGAPDAKGGETCPHCNKPVDKLALGQSSVPSGQRKTVARPPAAPAPSANKKTGRPGKVRAAAADSPSSWEVAAEATADEPSVVMLLVRLLVVIALLYVAIFVLPGVFKQWGWPTLFWPTP